MAHSATQIPHAAGRGRRDRISGLGDGVLGHVLSFLPAREAARAAALSRRWRDVFGGGAVHTLSLEQPESPIPSYEHWVVSSPRHSQPPPFTAVVTAALLARHRRCPDSPAAQAPLRALRVDMEDYGRGDASTVDHWVSYAMKQAVEELELELRLRRANVCGRRYTLRSAISPDQEDGDDAEVGVSDEEDADRRASPGRRRSVSDDGEHDDDDVGAAIPDGYSSSDNSLGARSVGEHDDGDYGSVDDDDADEYSDTENSEYDNDDGDDISTDGEDDVVSTDDERALNSVMYTVPRGLFSCAALRSLRIGPCRLSPPAAVSLPSLEELLLTRVSDDMHDVQRLISACPRLADLTLEACDTVTVLSLIDNTRLRRLAVRCCHSLAAVAVDYASQLRAFDYRGAVPDASFLTTRSGSRPSLSITSCKVDICGEEVSSEKELTKLNDFLHLFSGTKHLHLHSARLGSGLGSNAFTNLPAFSSLRHLELRGSLPHNDAAAAIIGAMSRILHHSPNLEVLSLVFTEPEPDGDNWQPGGCLGCTEGQLLDVHHLEYNRYDVLHAPPPSAAMIPCLMNRVREINLVHYQGGRAQRSLAKFLLSNAPVLDQLYCGFVPGPLWMQTELMEEIQGWATNKPENRIFY